MKNITFDGSVPTRWELCQLAALVYRDSGVESAKKSVKAALSIWREAGVEIDKAGATQVAIERHSSQSEQLLGPLKIGKHFLPGINTGGDPEGATFSGEFTPLDVFERLAVGMEKPDDRRRWLTGFLRMQVQRSQYLKEEIKGSKGDSSPSSLRGITVLEEVKSILKAWEEEGVPDATGWALDYRKWRLTRNSPTRIAPIHHEIEICVKKGLAELGLRAAKSRNRKRRRKTAAQGRSRSRAGSSVRKTRS